MNLLLDIVVGHAYTQVGLNAKHRHRNTLKYKGAKHTPLKKDIAILINCLLHINKMASTLGVRDLIVFRESILNREGKCPIN